MTRYFHHLQRWWLVCFSFFSVLACLACLACFACRFFRRVLLFDGLLFVLQFHRKTPDFGSGITTGFHLQIMAFDAMLRNVLDLNVVQWPHVSIQPKFRRIGILSQRLFSQRVLPVPNLDGFAVLFVGPMFFVVGARRALQGVETNRGVLACVSM
jgi:hypothetical protein